MLVIGEIAQPVAGFESVLMMVAKAVAGVPYLNRAAAGQNRSHQREWKVTVIKLDGADVTSGRAIVIAVNVSGKTALVGLQKRT